MLVEHFAGEPKMFQVVPYSDPKGQIKFTAKSVSQKRVWANQIKKAMLEHFNIPKRAQELVYKLGDEEGNILFLLEHYTTLLPINSLNLQLSLTLPCIIFHLISFSISLLCLFFSPNYKVYSFYILIFIQQIKYRIRKWN